MPTLSLHRDDRIERVHMRPFDLLITGLAVVYPVFGQVTTSNSHELTPEIGWDTLEARIEYPDLARRAELQGDVYAVVYISPSGAVDSVHIQSNAEIFLDSVNNAIRSTKWNCIRPCASDSIAITIHFLVRGMTTHPLYEDRLGAHVLYKRVARPKIEWIE
jgi:hypothetical protein